MQTLTEQQIRTSLVNASRREAAQMTPPDLDALAWDRLEVLGWSDRRSPSVAYAVVELDGAPAGVVLRAGSSGGPSGGTRRGALCAWCQDLVSTGAVLLVARRAGAAGRDGNTVGTLVCADFACSAHVRRPPSAVEAGPAADAAERERLVQRRIAALQERAARFVAQVAGTA